MIKSKEILRDFAAWKRVATTFVIIACVAILIASIVPIPKVFSASINSPLANAPASSTTGSVVLGTGSGFYSTTYNSYVTWSQTIYADSVSYFGSHLNFSSAALGSSSNPAWTFGVGVSGDNLVINQITSNFIELDDSPAPTATVDVFFYYAGSAPLNVSATGTTILPSSFLTSYSSFTSCSAPCVFLNTTGSYVEISNPAGSAVQNFVYPGAQPTSTTTTTTSVSTTTTTTTTTSRTTSSTTTTPTSTTTTTTTTKSATTTTPTSTTTTSRTTSTTTTSSTTSTITQSTTSPTTSTTTTTPTSTTTATTTTTSTTTTTPPSPPPPVTTTSTTSSETPIIITTSSTGSSSQTPTSSSSATSATSSSPTTSTLSHATTTASSSPTKSSTTPPNTSTNSTSTTSSTSSQSTNKKAPNSLLLFASIPYVTTNSPTPLGTGIFTVEVGLVTAAPFIIRKIAKKAKDEGDSHDWRW